MVEGDLPEVGDSVNGKLNWDRRYTHMRMHTSGKNTPATKLSMNRAYIPPGGVAKAHIHVDFEVMIYLLKGSVRHEYGDGCKKSVVHQAGDMFYIEPGLPHEVFNVSDKEEVHALVARSDASEWQNIIPYDRINERPIYEEE